LPITADLLMGRVSFTTDGTPDIETAAAAAAAAQPMTISRNIAWHSNSAAGPGQPIYIYPHRGTVPPLGFASTSAPGINPTGSIAPPPAEAVHFRSFWPRQIPAPSEAAAGPSMRRSRSRRARHSRHGPPAVAVTGDAGGPEMPGGVGGTERHSAATSQRTHASSGGAQGSDAGAAGPASGSGAVELTQARVETGAEAGATPDRARGGPHGVSGAAAGTSQRGGVETRAVGPLGLVRVVFGRPRVEARRTGSGREVAGGGAVVPAADAETVSGSRTGVVLAGAGTGTS
jgi:hypothetical protein